MPSPSINSVDLPIEALGGRVSQFDPQKLPSGASPFNQDVSFSSSGGVGTRPGMQSVYVAFAGNPTINYVRTFVDLVENFRQLSLDGLGNVRQEFPQGTLTIIGSVIAGAFAQSDTYAGREWLAIGDGQFGLDIPRQWDGTNFDRVSQTGPGVAPVVADEASLTLNIAASPTGLIQPTATPLASPNGLSQAGTTVTFTLGAAPPAGLKTGDIMNLSGATNTAYNAQYTITLIGPGNQLQGVSPNVPAGQTASGGGTLAFFLVTVVLNPAATPFTVGQLVTIAGAGVAGYNGTWTVRSVNAGVSFNLTLNITGLVASGAGTATLTGNVSQGLHQVSVLFVTRSGYLTCPAPPVSWTAAGLHRVVLTNIPIGPPNIIQRIVIFTPVIVAPANAGPFFYFSGPTPSGSTTFPSMVIGDNTTTSGTFDFLDSVLQNATPATNLFNLLELGECSSVVQYSERLFWSGERNKVHSAGGGGGFNNLSIDGGWSIGTAVGGGDVPLGWTGDPSSTFSTGGTKSPDVNVYWGGAYRITGDGATAVRGRIFQTAYQDYLGVSVLSPNTSYSVRARIVNQPGSAVFAQGNIQFELSSASLAFSSKLTVAANLLTNTYKEFSGLLTAGLAVIPSDLLFRVYMDGTPTNAAAAIIDCIEPYPTLQPVNRTIIRVSYAGNPESYDVLTGFMVVGKDNGQAVRCMTRLLDNKLYLNKERSKYVTSDDNANEPSSWVISTVSDTVGTPSVHGACIGEVWEIVANHDGAYIFFGSDPVKISQEIQPDWNTINWAAAQNMYTVVDTANKRVHIGAPTGASTIPNTEFVMDYSQLNSAQEIADHPQAYYSQFAPGKVIAPGRARKWTLWNLLGGLGANCAAMTLRNDGSYHLLRGNASGTGKIYDQVATQLSDDGIAIACTYQTYFCPEVEQEQMLQLGSHRKLFKYLTGYTAGSGAMFFTITGPQGQRQKSLTTLLLSLTPGHEFEMNLNYVGERASIIFGTNAVGSWFFLAKLCPVVQKELFTPVRGSA